MRPRLTGLVLACALALGAPVRADVTVSAKSTLRGSGSSSQGRSVTYVKGHRMRTDLVVNGETRSIVIDLDAGSYVSIDYRARTAEEYTASTVGADLDRISDRDVAVSMTPNGQSRQIAGEPCTGYDLSVAVTTSLSPPGGTPEPLTIRIAGPVFVAERTPARKEWTAFYDAANARGRFTNVDPRTARVQPGQARGFAAIYRRIAQLGVSYAQDLTLTFTAGGPLGATLARMGQSTFSTEVESVSTAALADDLFGVPAGFAVTNRTP